MKTANSLLLFITAMLPVPCLGITEQELTVFGTIESSNNPEAVGDGGKARGEFQFHESAWAQTSKLRKAKGKKIFHYSYAHDRAIARAYAQDYIEWFETQLAKRLGRKPELWEVYAAYNRGLEGFARLNYQFDRLPPHTQRACLRISSLLSQSSTKVR